MPVTADDAELIRAAAENQLEAQALRAYRYQTYYDGEPALVAIMDTAERRVFRSLQDEARANWCELVVNAVAERLQVTGFRFGNAEANQAAWDIWQASNMDADGELVQTDALVQASSFVLVQLDDDNPTGVQLTGESAMESTVLYEPGSRHKRLAGYKRFPDVVHGGVVQVLILDDEIWTWYPDEQDPIVENNSAGVVNLIEVQPQPRTIGYPRSELHAAIPFQDRINTGIWNRIVASDFGAFRQIWATGLKLARRAVIQSPLPDEPTNAERLQGVTNFGAEQRTETLSNGRVVKPFNVGADRLLVNENPEGRFGSLPEATLDGYLKAAEQDVQHLAAITQTPPQYLMGVMVNISADAIKAAEAGLVAKISRRALHIGEAWEEIMRLAMQLVGAPDAINVGAEVIWADWETRSEAQRVDAATKATAVGMPQQVAWARYLGATPAEVSEWVRLNAEAAAAQPIPPVVPPPVIPAA
jgi:hypothetical protein